ASPVWPGADLDHHPVKECVCVIKRPQRSTFLNDEGDPDIYNPFVLETPASPHQVMAGTIIAATLLTGLNSDLPGQVVAQVSEPVYDTVTGQTLLIPQGARLIGRYDSLVAYGQSRALLVWTRIVMPDGSSIRIDNLPALDVRGYAGLKDKVDHHAWRLMQGVALSTVLSVGAELARDEDDDIARAITDGVQGGINDAGQQIVRRQLNVQPTLTIRPGWRLRIIANKDIILRPYQGG
ncbi:MAG: TrbI/VirB10 family protein, partial [Pseudomonadota bacterium]